MICKFKGFVLAGHVFISFGFANGDYLSISIDARLRQGDSYSVAKSMRAKWPLAYIISNEKDAILKRTERDCDNLFLFPLKLRRDRISALLLDMLGRADKLVREPKLYSIFSNSCSTNLFRHINAVWQDRVRWGYHMTCPRNSESAAHRHGLLGRSKLSEIRKQGLLNRRTALYRDHPDFSRLIRQDQI
jgi:hypothetical protein